MRGVRDSLVGHARRPSRWSGELKRAIVRLNCTGAQGSKHIVRSCIIGQLGCPPSVKRLPRIGARAGSERKERGYYGSSKSQGVRCLAILSGRASGGRSTAANGLGPTPSSLCPGRAWGRHRHAPGVPLMGHARRLVAWSKPLQSNERWRDGYSQLFPALDHAGLAVVCPTSIVRRTSIRNYASSWRCWSSRLATSKANFSACFTLL